MNILRAALAAIDRYQQGRRGLRFLVAVYKKFNDDRGGQLAALIAYYGFFSLFPLLLLLVTILGFVLQSNPGVERSVLRSTLAQFPIIGSSLHLHAVKGSGVGLAVGVIGATLGGLGITNAAQSAFDEVWNVPRNLRRSFFDQRLRGLMLLGVFGVLMLASAVIAGFVTASTHGTLTVIGGVLVAFAVNLILFFAIFRLLSVREAPTRQLLPGIVAMAVIWQIFEHIGGFYIDHVVKRASPASSLFALVIGLLTWLYLGARLLLLTAEANVVRARRLWPRSLFGPPQTDADERVERARACIE